MDSKFRVVIYGDTAAEIKTKVLEIAAEFCGASPVPTQEPGPKNVHFTETAHVVELAEDEQDEQPESTGPMKFDLPKAPVISQGKQWEKVPGTNAYAGNPVDVDSSGLPWDSRIHVESKAKTTKGEWINKRKLDKAFLAKTETELRERMTVGAPPATEHPAIAARNARLRPGASEPQAVPLGGLPPATLPGMVLPGVPAFAQPQAEPVVQAPPPIQAPAADGLERHDFNSFKRGLPMILAKLTKAGKIDNAYIKELAEYFGVVNLWEVVKDDAKTQELFQQFVAYGMIAEV